ncbi:hypothetical protein PHYPSEUDO_015148 [Phytophthora pseudosyringae]|uniref:SP-RING-type domain-containing protein n=1 Tax=Phytophthora pseudosyringae TaxID=221518 RepID=A0A8T1V4F4_9STRA|nr:hypothetical protein PHYPSEUDO_015148 [Phytophthora pseudosyringae]
MLSGGSCSPPSAQRGQHTELFLELAEESTSAQTELGATLAERMKYLEQQKQELQEGNAELKQQTQKLKQEKDHYAKRAEDLEDKRDQLWGDVADLQDALQATKKELEDALGSRSDHRQAETVLREELGSLRQRLREQEAAVCQATTESKERVREAIERETLLKKTVKQLEKRLRDQIKLIRDQQASFSHVTAQSNERARDANAKQTLLKERVEQIEQRLEGQRKAFEEERAHLQQQANNSRQNDAQAEVNSSLESAIPQLRSLLSAYDRVKVAEKCRSAGAGIGRRGAAHKELGQGSDSDLVQRLSEQEISFDKQRARLLEQASDAAETQRDITRRNLLECEKGLLCPITLELLEFPVVTGCCGKTFSSEGLRQALRQNPLCPFCRERLSSTHPNRDVAKLVELHRSERSVLGMSDTESSHSTVPTCQPNEDALPPAAPTGRAHSNRITGSSSTHQSRHREHRSERVQARSEVSHRRSLLLRSAHVNAAPDTTSTVALISSAVVPTPSETQTHVRSITPGGLSVSTVGRDGTITRVPPHMVRSVLASIRSPSARSQSITGNRRQRGRSRVASSAPLTALPRTTSASRRRTAKSSAGPRTASSAGPRTASSAVPSAMPISASQSKRPANSSISAAVNTPIDGVPTSATSIGAISAAMRFPDPNVVPSAYSTDTANGLWRSQESRSSAASDPSASMDSYMKSWVHAYPSAIAASSSARAVLSSAVTTATATASTATTSASRHPVRISASQDDSALMRQRHDSPRLTASQPAPRQPLRNLAQSITTLEDLLGSNFNSDSDSV